LILLLASIVNSRGWWVVAVSELGNALSKIGHPFDARLQAVSLVAQIVLIAYYLLSGCEQMVAG
jgi:hypothetical protein